jgi:SAM-dependent methyltransferase
MNLFASASMAQGYAKARPPIHAWVIERVRERLGLAPAVGVAVDVGCGSGLSTAPLAAIARLALGLEPALPMLPWARTVAPMARFAGARAEGLPLRSGCVDLMTAAGSLNYADLDRFFPEARRALDPGGVLVVYDFGQGRSFRDAPALSAWFAEFASRYPLPPGAARALDPAILASLDSGFRLQDKLEFELALPYDAQAYLDYVMSEANVPHAVENGSGEQQIRTWCAQTLAPVFAGASHQVVFAGYVAFLVPAERHAPRFS